MAAPAPTARRSRKASGQSTVEFMLMVPVLFAILFFLIEMSLYFTTLHYGTYAAFATARAQQVGFGAVPYTDVSSVSRLILTGAVWDSNAAQPLSLSGRVAGVGVQMTKFQEKVPFPFIKPLLPNMDFQAKVFLGPDERGYEGVEGRNGDQYDNNL